MFDKDAFLQCNPNNLCVDLLPRSSPTSPPGHADNPVHHLPQAQARLDAEEEDIQEATQNMEEEASPSRAPRT